MARTRTLKYISPDQIFTEVVEQLQKDGTYNPNLLYRCFRTANIPILRKEGNDRVAEYNPKKIQAGWRRYKQWKQTGKKAGDFDWETFDLLSRFNLMIGDFIFASTDAECRDGLETDQGDYAFFRLTKNPFPTSVSIWTPDNLKELDHHGFGFINNSRKAKKASLVGVFKVQDMPRLNRWTF